MGFNARHTEFKGHLLESYREAAGRYCARILEGPTRNNDFRSGSREQALRDLKAAIVSEMTPRAAEPVVASPDTCACTRYDGHHLHLQGGVVVCDGCDLPLPVGELAANGPRPGTAAHRALHHHHLHPQGGVVVCDGCDLPLPVGELAANGPRPGTAAHRALHHHTQED